MLPLDAAIWAEAASTLLHDTAAWRKMSQHSRQLVQPYTAVNAALGITLAVRHAAQA